MAQTETRVSVVIPVFDGERYLAEAVESVLAQTRPVFEIIVVDDGSTDGSARVASRFGETVQYCYQTHAGPAAARNRGIEMARGNFLAFLDADDVWVQEKMEKQLAAFEEDPALELVLGSVKEFFSPELDESVTRKLWANPNALRGYMIGAIVIRSDSFWRVGLLDTRWQISEFIDWYQRAHEAGLRERVLPEMVLWRRLHQTNNGIRMRGARGEYAFALKAAIERRRKGQPRVDGEEARGA
jgi:glycosyltransferase involved in cell wall biosynthesis